MSTYVSMCWEMLQYGHIHVPTDTFIYNQTIKSLSLNADYIEQVVNDDQRLSVDLFCPITGRQEVVGYLI